jgi:cytochrome o ubiquinol oxidase subunit IV
MSRSPSGTRDEQNAEHGTMRSYVIGFILSLLFTFIPYYLVVNRTFTGTTLLAVILGFAVLQMVIQVTFFLHLGRGPKPNWNLFFFISTIGIILVVVGGSILIINNLNYNMMPSDQAKKLVGDEGIYQVGGEKTGACQGQHANHKITIKNDLVYPAHTEAHMCDTLTFMNAGSEPREITFGTHQDHGVYAGESDLTIRKGRPKSITLSEVGTYQFHEHLRAEMAGDFTVLP